MSLAKVKDLLIHAQEHGYGIPAINVFDYNSIKFAAMAAEEAKMPLIIQYFPGFDVHAPLVDIRNIAVAFARRASVPIAVHLDHSRSFEIAVSGLGAGFPSVMVDGSALPYEENVSLTAEVTRCAHAMGVDVEAELGHVGVGMNLEDMTNTDHFTNPDQAVDFVSRTGVDSLAIAVGNAHGNYIRTPELDFDRDLQAAGSSEHPSGHARRFRYPQRSTGPGGEMRYVQIQYRHRISEGFLQQYERILRGRVPTPELISRPCAQSSGRASIS